MENFNNILNNIIINLKNEANIIGRPITKRVIKGYYNKALNNGYNQQAKAYLFILNNI